MGRTPRSREPLLQAFEMTLRSMRDRAPEAWARFAANRRADRAREEAHAAMQSLSAKLVNDPADHSPDDFNEQET